MKFTKVLKENIPYVMFFYLGNIFSNHIRSYDGDIIDKIINGFNNIGSLKYFPSFNLYDLGIGILFAFIIKFIVYTKGKKRKNFREGKEYGSARWSA